MQRFSKSAITVRVILRLWSLSPRSVLLTRSFQSGQIINTAIPTPRFWRLSRRLASGFCAQTRRAMWFLKSILTESCAATEKNIEYRILNLAYEILHFNSYCGLARRHGLAGLFLRQSGG